MNEDFFYVVYCTLAYKEGFEKIYYEGNCKAAAEKIKRQNKWAEISEYPPHCWVPDKTPATIAAVQNIFNNK